MKILFVSKRQYGYLTAYYKFYQMINAADNKSEAFYFSFDNLKEKYADDYQRVYYCSNKHNFSNELKKHIRQNHYDMVVSVYYPGISLLPCSIRRNTVLDIRTGSTDSNPYKRRIKDAIMKAEMLFFRNKSILSHSLAKKLHVKKYFYLPLGGDLIISPENDFKKLKLIYVGIIRDGLHQMVKGFYDFIEETGVDAVFVIIGSGKPQYVNRLQEAINTGKNRDKIIYMGYIKYSELIHFLKDANVGVSYIPKRKYFEMQPPTKTYEYLLAGMPCIATSTFENSRIVTEVNGVLCEDHSVSFSEALKLLWDRRNTYLSEKIQMSVREYCWDHILKNQLELIANKVCGQSLLK